MLQLDEILNNLTESKLRDLLILIKSHCCIKLLLKYPKLCIRGHSGCQIVVALHQRQVLTVNWRHSRSWWLNLFLMKEAVLADRGGQAPHWSFSACFYDSPLGNQLQCSGTVPISIISWCESSLMFLSTSEEIYDSMVWTDNGGYNWPRGKSKAIGKTEMRRTDYISMSSPLCYEINIFLHVYAV